MAISMDLRIRIFEARESGESTSEVAERFDVSPAFVRRLMQRYRETGSLAPSSAPRGRKPQLSGHADQLRQLHAEKPDLTAPEVRDRLGLTVAAVTVWRMLRRLGLTFKKSHYERPSSSARTSKKLANSGRTPSSNGRPNV